MKVLQSFGKNLADKNSNLSRQLPLVIF